MSYTEYSLAQFLAELAAHSPTPGGGSASALSAALGTALGSMAAVYTTGQEKFKAVEAQALACDSKFTSLRFSFLELMQNDSDAYEAFVFARAMPKNTSDEKAARQRALAAARETATVVPERVVSACIEGLHWVDNLSRFANVNLAGDVAAAAYFLEAAARGAGIQILSNCATADKEGINAARRAACTEKIAQCQAAREQIHNTVLAMLKL